MEMKGIESVLAQLRTAREMAAGQLAPRAIGAGAVGNAAAKTGAPDFSTVLKTSLQQVSNAQMEATQKAQAFELGVPGATLHDAMVSVQKANISFQATVTVRNKLVQAYHDIMNMQV